MLYFRRAYVVNLAAAGGHDTVDVPFESDDAVQYLSASVYMLNALPLPAGSMQFARNGALVGAATAFAGSSIVVPVYSVAGSEQIIQPPSVNKLPGNGSTAIAVLTAGTSASTFARAAAPVGQTYPNPTLAARVINTSASPVQIWVEWMGLIRRV